MGTVLFEAGKQADPMEVQMGNTNKTGVALQADRIRRLDAAVQRLLTAHEARTVAEERLHVDGYKSEQLFNAFCACDGEVISAQANYQRHLGEVRVSSCIAIANEVRRAKAHGEAA